MILRLGGRGRQDRGNSRKMEGCLMCSKYFAWSLFLQPISNSVPSIWTTLLTYFPSPSLLYKLWNINIKRHHFLNHNLVMWGLWKLRKALDNMKETIFSLSMPDSKASLTVFLMTPSTSIFIVPPCSADSSCLPTFSRLCYLPQLPYHFLWNSYNAQTKLELCQQSTQLSIGELHF